MASFLCLCIVALLAAACGTEWYTETGSGNFPEDQNPLPYFTYEIKEYIFHLEGTFKITNNSITTDTSESCNYDGQCDFRGGAPWDLSDYQGTYIAIFVFCILAMVMATIHGIYLQVLNWKTNFSPLLAKILTIVSVVTSVLLIIFVTIAWALIWNHPVMLRNATGFPDSTCNDLNSDNQNSEGAFCLWEGSLSWGDFQQAMPTFPNATDVIYFHTTWGPSTAWILTTIAFGFSAWVNLLTFGWRPGFQG